MMASGWAGLPDDIRCHYPPIAADQDATKSITFPVFPASRRTPRTALDRGRTKGTFLVAEVTGITQVFAVVLALIR
jgi:hypothetical protein